MKEAQNSYKILISTVQCLSASEILNRYSWLEVCDFVKKGIFPNEYSDEPIERIYIEGNAEHVLKTIAYIGKTFQKELILDFRGEFLNLEIYDNWRE